jgi:hypothetical protein
MNSFYEFIPHQELKNMVEGGIADFQSKMQGNGLVDKGFMDKFFRNNYADTKVVPEMKIISPLGRSANYPAGMSIDNTGMMTIDADEPGASKNKAKRPYVLVKIIVETPFGMNERSTLYKKYAVSGNTGYYIPVPKLGTYAQGNYIYEYNSDIGIDGLSSIPQNNLMKGKDMVPVMQKVKEKLDKMIADGDADVANVIKESKELPSIDNNNEDKNLDKGENDGTFNEKCD